MYYHRKVVLMTVTMPERARAILDDAVAEFSRATMLPLAFGGLESQGIAEISSLVGNHTSRLKQLRVRTGLGLGGRVMEEKRARITANYAASSVITHDYDTEVIGEGVRALYAVPVVVEGRVAAVLYGGTRNGSELGGSCLKSGELVATNFAQELERELRIDAEVERRVQERLHIHSANGKLETAPRKPDNLIEALRYGHSELRKIMTSVEDPKLLSELQSLERRILGEPVGAAPALSPREIDVLTVVAHGASNSEISKTLGLKESTIKSYLHSAMSKLEASTRHAAVVAARRSGIIL